MIANISLKTSIKLFKSKAGTRTRQISIILQKLGFQCEIKLTKITKNFKIPKSGIYLFKLTWNNKKGSHWVIWNGDEQRWYDPGNQHYLHKDYYFKHSISMYPTSYLEIVKISK